jgi:hypothetical protein
MDDSMDRMKFLSLKWHELVGAGNCPGILNKIEYVCVVHWYSCRKYFRSLEID